MKLDSFDFNTGWKRKDSIQLADRKYEVTIKIQAYSKEDSLTAEQEANVDEYLSSGLEWIKAIDKKLCEYAENYLERFVPRTMLFKKDGDVALLCDDNDDPDGGIAVCVKPSLEIKLQDDYL